MTPKSSSIGLSTFRNMGASVGARKQGPWFLTVLVFACLVSPSYGLDPNRQLSQYIWQRWGTESEFPGGPIHTIWQTPDGYLWIGTDGGIVRFDGFNFRTVPLAPYIPDPNGPVLGLTTDSDGNLMVQPQGGGLLRQRSGGFEGVDTEGLVSEVSQVTAMWRERDGGLLFADLGARTLLRLRNRRIQPVMSPDVLARMAPVMVLAESVHGRIWVGTLNAGLFSLKNGQVESISSDRPHAKINCLLPMGEDQVWLGTDDGAFRWDGAKFARILLPAPLGDAQVLSMLRDRDSNIWVGTVRGLARINGNGMSIWDEGQPRSGAINALFEDREGNIWVGGSRGLERIRDSAFLTYSVTGGLPSDHIGPIYVDPQNRTWLAPIEGGLYLLNAGKVQAIKVARLNSDVVYSIAGGNDGVIWIGRQHGGITRLRLDDGVI